MVQDERGGKGVRGGKKGECDRFPRWAVGQPPPLLQPGRWLKLVKKWGEKKWGVV